MSVFTQNSGVHANAQSAKSLKIQKDSNIPGETSERVRPQLIQEIHSNGQPPLILPTSWRP